jgi:MEDS: MEthanogen/methylotroph, DcmR Sensory domain
MTKARVQKSASSGAGSVKHESCPEIEISKYAPMSIDMRKTGFDVVGDMPWGTHFCLFYETKPDLLEIAVAYCKAGLVAQEFCLWVVADPLTVEEATRALKQAVPDCDRYFADESIDIVRARDWYLPDGTFDLKRVICGWNEKLARALTRGYAGVGSPAILHGSSRKTGETSLSMKNC